MKLLAITETGRVINIVATALHKLKYKKGDALGHARNLRKHAMNLLSLWNVCHNITSSKNMNRNFADFICMLCIKTLIVSSMRLLDRYMYEMLIYIRILDCDCACSQKFFSVSGNNPTTPIIRSVLVWSTFAMNKCFLWFTKLTMHYLNIPSHLNIISLCC